jgi:hypothetical protein
MKKSILGIMVSLLPFAALADSYTYPGEVTSTATQWYVSDDIPVAGELDRIVLWNTDPKGTSVVVIANYAGDEIADIIYTGTVVNSSGAPVVVRPRRVGTGTSGTALTYGIGSGSAALTNLATQILTVPYEKFILGGNTKARVVDAGTTTVTNYMNAQFIFKR